MKRLTKALTPLLAAFLLVLLVVAFAQRRRSASQVRPRRAADGGAAAVTVKAGGDLQAALDAARPGDTILLEAGASFTGPFTLPNKGAGEAYITVQSTRAAELREGVRVTPEQAALMPKLVSPGRAAPALKTAPGAHHWRLVGVEIAPRDASAVVYDLVLLGDGTAAQSSYEQVPHHLTLDRCYIHAARDGELKRGIALHSAATEIVGCHVSGFKVKGQEAQAIGGWNGPGPYRIVNNYLEGAGENLMLGGAVASLPNLVPTDIEISRNHFFKPTEWRDRYTVKNILELKNARRVRIEGNLFENCWPDAQAGYAILFTARPNDSGPAAVVEDVEFVNNVVRDVSAGVHLLGQDDLYSAGPLEKRLRRVRIANNLFEAVDGPKWGGDGCFLKVASGTVDVTVEHNTVLQTGNIAKVAGTPHERFIFRANIVRHNEYGLHGDEVGAGNAALARYFPGGRFTNNVIVREGGAPPNTQEFYPTGNSFPARLADVGFVSLAERNYRLSPGSRFKRAAGGRDPGCDFDQLNAAMGGVR